MHDTDCGITWRARSAGQLTGLSLDGRHCLESQHCDSIESRGQIARRIRHRQMGQGSTSRLPLSHFSRIPSRMKTWRDIFLNIPFKNKETTNMKGMSVRGRSRMACLSVVDPESAPTRPRSFLQFHMIEVNYKFHLPFTPVHIAFCCIRGRTETNGLQICYSNVPQCKME